MADSRVATAALGMANESTFQPNPELMRDSNDVGGAAGHASPAVNDQTDIMVRVVARPDPRRSAAEQLRPLKVKLKMVPCSGRAPRRRSVLRR